MDIHIPKTTAKWLGMLSSASILGLWLVIVSTKQSLYPQELAAGWTAALGPWIFDTVDVKMLAFAAAGILLAFFQRPLLMIVDFLVLFIPAGLYTLGLPSWARLIGIACLLFLIASMMMLAARYRVVLR